MRLAGVGDWTRCAARGDRREELVCAGCRRAPPEVEVELIDGARVQLCGKCSGIDTGDPLPTGGWTFVAKPRRWAGQLLARPVS